jgi:hypothetical protein
MTLGEPSVKVLGEVHSCGSRCRFKKDVSILEVAVTELIAAIVADLVMLILRWVFGGMGRLPFDGLPSELAAEG